MIGKSKKLLSSLLAMAMALGLFAAMPRTARALSWVEVDAANATVTIADGDSESAISALINDLVYGLNDSGLNVNRDSYTTITVEGSKTNAVAKLSMTLPGGATVIWRADYAGATAADELIYLGLGALKIVDGSITKTDAGGYAIHCGNVTATIEVSGGTISSSGITINTPGNINVSGGIISTTNSSAIYLQNANSTINVSGGRISATTGTAIIAPGANVNIEVSNGTVSATTGYAIYAYGANDLVTVSGGTVSATAAGGTAILNDLGSTVVTGGNVSSLNNVISTASGAAAYLAGTCTAGSFATTNGMIVEVDTLVIPASRNGGSDGLTTVAGGNTAVWDTTGATPVIAFTLSNGGIPQIPWGSNQQVQPAFAGGGYSGGAKKPSTPAPKAAFPVNAEVVVRRITVYKTEQLRSMLLRLNKGEKFTVIGLANNGRALLIEHDGQQGYAALKDISFMLETPIRATALKKAAAYAKLESGKLKRIGYYDKEQTQMIYGISGKYLISKQANTVYYLDAGQWRLWVPAN